jgi:hypothetical protein
LKENYPLYHACSSKTRVRLRQMVTETQTDRPRSAIILFRFETDFNMPRKGCDFGEGAITTS